MVDDAILNSVALAALMISIIAAMFTAWQALAQHRATLIERDRRHDERTPVFEARAFRNHEKRITLSLRLTSPRSIENVRLELENYGNKDPYLYFWEWDKMHTWDARSWQVADIHYLTIGPDGVDSGAVEKIEGLVTCTEKGESPWRIPVTFDLSDTPPDGTKNRRRGR